MFFIFAKIEAKNSVKRIFFFSVFITESDEKDEKRILRIYMFQKYTIKSSRVICSLYEFRIRLAFFFLCLFSFHFFFFSYFFLYFSILFASSRLIVFLGWSGIMAGRAQRMNSICSYTENLAVRKGNSVIRFGAHTPLFLTSFLNLFFFSQFLLYVRNSIGIHRATLILYSALPCYFTIA